MKNTLKGSLALIVSRASAGLNVNCSKYLLSSWFTPAGFVALRLLFGTLFFWAVGIFDKPDLSSQRDRVKLFFLGAIAVFGYMMLYAVGISYTTPVNFALINALQPIWVFLFSVVCCNERVTSGKVVGILLGFSGVAATLFSESSSEYAVRPFAGNAMAFISSLLYAFYLLSSSALLRRVSNIVMLKYTFLGALVSSIVAFLVSGATVPRIFSNYDPTAVLTFLFVLLFPTALSYLLVPIGVKYLKTTLVAMYSYVTLFTATLISVFTGQDRFDAALFFALLLICVGIFLVGKSERREQML